MKTKCINDEREISKFSPFCGKTLGVFLLCIFNFFSAQNKILNTDAIYVSGGAEIIEEKGFENFEKSTIYVSADVKFLNFASETNFEIVKISKSKKLIVSKTVRLAKKKKVILKPKSELPKLVENQPEKLQTFTSLPESGRSFSANQNHKTAVAQSHTFTLKHFLQTRLINFRPTFLDSSKTKTRTYLADFNCKIHSESYSVRPPPFLA